MIISPMTSIVVAAIAPLIPQPMTGRKFAALIATVFSPALASSSPLPIMKMSPFLSSSP